MAETLLPPPGESNHLNRPEQKSNGEKWDQWFADFAKLKKPRSGFVGIDDEKLVAPLNQWLAKKLASAGVAMPGWQAILQSPNYVTIARIYFDNIAVLEENER